ncbi:SMI1/KNR4 family protein [Tuwongella immobilis]|uniref:Knr4/Smi1-like domain-containing protein n=1 Tax=Tuwongella immobilis TaxID=692036 RepID=A0A6C2YQQ0_9BACT|nr:SMI1/KNR4 family protein [Tuwongella immobilis]VIP03724.1 Uncharacterized protein OS=Paenibacillus mucilaginosus 3016 GN=PM3016_4683 PE=4 SV=1 [Tuwongella immobilis]VTS04816.1 Uncharacterized protein OS=Paenibacillus mucilaginosus 3016 GN=PM3016_4683 PE=4 SV=1 [Tuwongella immobilis]
MFSPPDFVRRLVDSNIAEEQTIIPCTGDEVALLEDSVKLRLPPHYKSFLLTAGKCAGALLLDCDWLYPELKSLTDQSRAMLRGYEGSNLLMPDTAFVCLDRREQFFFFDTTTEGCKLFSYFEEDGKFTELPSTFFEFLEEELQSFEAQVRAAPESPYWERFRATARERAKRLQVK